MGNLSPLPHFHLVINLSLFFFHLFNLFHFKQFNSFLYITFSCLCTLNFENMIKNLLQRSILISSTMRVKNYCKIQCSILTSKTQEQTVKYFFIWCTSTYSQRTRPQILWELCIINFYSINTGFKKWITSLWSRQSTLQHVQPRHLKKAWLSLLSSVSRC